MENKTGKYIVGKKKARALFSAVLSILLIASVALSGCTSTDATVSKKTKQKVIFQINECNAAVGASSTTGTWSGGTITLDQCKACQSREEYLQLVMPCYQFYCQKYGIKYPGVLALQTIYEQSMPQGSGAPSLEYDNNMGGLKYYGPGIPNATAGTLSPSSEGSTPYCHFTSIDKYIEAACYTVSGDTYKVAREQNNMQNFTYALCDIWIKGDMSVSSGATAPYDYGYASEVIADYEKYGLAKYEGAIVNGGSANSANKNKTAVTSSDQDTLIGEDNAEKIWNYLKADGYTDNQAAGIMGNFQAESGFDPTIVQGGGHFTELPVPVGSGNTTGYGLAQWTYYTRVNALHDFAQNKGTQDNDLLTQLQFFDSEFADSKEEYTAIDDVEECTRWFHSTYEKSADNEEQFQRRVDYAFEVIEQFGGTAQTNGTTVSNGCNEQAADSSMVSVGEAATIGEGLDEAGKEQARIEWLFGSNGLPQSMEEAKTYLTEITVEVYNDDGSTGTMTMEVHKKLASEIQAVFKDMVLAKFPVTSICGYGDWRWSESERFGDHQSYHAYGLAVDINPDENYYYSPSTGKTVGSCYSPGTNKHSVTDEIVNIWKKHGFYWGGDWTDPKDYMHFSYLNG